MQPRHRLLLIGLLGLAPSACIQGPRAFQASHALHNEALKTRIDEELLLNLVRLRYRESPLFVQVGSIVTQFEINSSLGVNGDLTEGGPGGLEIGAGFGWSEQPTYTFTPLQDDEFVRRLLTPIALDVVVLLQRSGWSIERVLRLTAQNLGGLDNAASASGPTPDQEPVFAEFLQLTRLLRGLQRQGRVQLGYEDGTDELSPPIASSSVLGADLVRAAAGGMRFRPTQASADQLVLTKSKEKPVLEVSPRAGDNAELKAFLQALGLPDGRSRYAIVPGAWTGRAGGPVERETIGLSTRSLMGTFFYLSQGIDIPEAHLAQGLVTVTRDADGQAFDWRQLTGDLLRVKTARYRPASAAVAVPHRGNWFYIEDSDLESKSTFALLHELFNLSANPSSAAGPTLTLPIGG